MHVKDSIKINSVNLKTGKYTTGDSGKQINMGKKHWRMKFQMIYGILVGYL
jgi:hypothetical protein